MLADGRIVDVKPSVIVWDLETVPDLGGFAAANDLVGKSDVEIREAIGDRFPKSRRVSAIGRISSRLDLTPKGRLNGLVSGGAVAK